MDDESSGAGSPFHQVASSSCSSHGSSSNGNALCLFYSANSSALRSHIIQSSRDPNSWIASLRRQSIDPSASVTRALDGRQDHHELSTTAGRIVPSTVYGRSCSSPSLMNGPFSTRSGRSSSAGLAFYRSASLESIQRSRRLRQLALQSTSKVRSLTARESTAAAERWRYIQSVLERRRRESLERRERFIRQPLENIIRHKAAQLQSQHVQHWSNISRRSILKNHADHQPDQIARPSKWMSQNTKRHVRFDIQQDGQTFHYDDPDDDCQREKLPVLPATEESNGVNSTLTTMDNNDGMRRLPPLLPTTNSSISSGGIRNPEADPIRPNGPSWVERQVAKVKQRKLWAQQQQNSNKTASPAGPAGPAGIKVLKRTASLLVNVSDESDSGSIADDDSLEEDRSAGHPDWPLPRNGQRYLAWEVWLDKDETGDESGNQQKPPDPIPDAYGGWPHFPVRLAVGIKGRQESLQEKRAGRRKKNASHDLSHSNSFVRRKRFSKSLLMAVIRLRARNMAKRASAIHQRSAEHPSARPEKTKNLPNGPIPSQSRNHQVPSKPPEEQGASLPCLPNIPEEMADPESEEELSSSPDRDGLIRLSLDHRPDLMNRGKDAIEIFPEEPDCHTCSSDAGPIIFSSPVLIDTGQPTDANCQNAEVSDRVEERIHPESIDGLVGGASFNQNSCDGQRVEPLTNQLDCLSEPEDAERERIDNGAGPVVEGRLKNPATDPVATAQSDGPSVIPATVTRVQSGQVLTATRISTDAGQAGSPSPMTLVSEEEAVIQPGVQQADHVSDDEGFLSFVKDGQSLFDARSASIVPAETISNQDDDIPPNPLFRRDDFEALTSEEPVTFSRAKSKSSTEEAAGQESQHQLDKKTKEARNVLRMTSVTIATQTEPFKPALMEREPARHKNDIRKSMNSQTWSSSSSGSDGTTSESCHCLHRAVLTCLLPEAADTLAGLELIRRQLKKARIRGQQEQQQQHPSHSKTRHGRQPLSARVDVSRTGAEASGST